MRACAAFALLLLAGCPGEYQVNSTNKPPKEPTDSAPLPDDPTICERLPDPGAANVTLNTKCNISLQTGSFTPIVEGSWGSGTFCGPPAVGQIYDTNGSGAIDRDDVPIIVFYDGGAVTAVRGDGGGAVWSTAPGYGQDGGFAIGDLNSDKWPEVVTGNATTICALDGRTGSQLWCTGGLGASLDPMGYTYPSIADMDGDGDAEVTAGSVILNGQTGAVRGVGPYGKGAAPYGGVGTSTYGVVSVPVDLDGDGQLELVTGNAAYGVDGAVRWYNGGPDGIPAIADFDGDGQGEIVKTSGIYVTGMETDGTVVWGPKVYSGNLGAPAIDDLDGDGVPEIVFAAQNALVAMEWGGAEIWRAAITDNSGAAGPTLFDFEMDGYPEVLYADETTIRFFSGLDGSVKFTSAAHASYTVLETPIVVDVDGDQQVEIVLGHCSAGYGAITVYGDLAKSWPPGRKVWNQHAYSITNIGDRAQVPRNAKQNWPRYNNFRSGDIGRSPGEYLDLTTELLGVCEDECDAGSGVLWARPLNQGNIEAPAGIPVSLRAGVGGPVLDLQTTTQAIPPSSSGELLEFGFDSALLGSATPVITVNDDLNGNRVAFECDEKNNSVSAELLCQ